MSGRLGKEAMRVLPWLIDVADAVDFGVDDGPEIESTSVVGQVWYVDVLSARHVPVVLVIRCSGLLWAEMQRPRPFTHSFPCGRRTTSKRSNRSSKSIRLMLVQGRNNNPDGEGLAGSM